MWVSAGLFPSGEGGWGHSPARATLRGNISHARPLGNTDLHNGGGSPLRKPDPAGRVPSLPLEQKAGLALPNPAAAKWPAGAGLPGPRVQGRRTLPQAVFLGSAPAQRVRLYCTREEP